MWRFMFDLLFLTILVPIVMEASQGPEQSKMQLWSNLNPLLSRALNFDVPPLTTQTISFRFGVLPTPLRV
jgi:hypothetical protein